MKIWIKIFNKKYFYFILSYLQLKVASFNFILHIMKMKGGNIIGLPIIPTRTQEEAYTDIIESIALEEAALAHVVNAESEKVQATATMMETGQMAPNDVITFQNAVARIIQTAIKMQMLLEFKLETIIDIITRIITTIFENIATVTAEADGIIVTNSSRAFYFTKTIPSQLRGVTNV